MAWTTPANWPYGLFVDSDFLHTEVRDRIVALHAGAMGISGQTAGKIPYASSTEQLAVSDELVFDGATFFVGGNVSYNTSGVFSRTVKTADTVYLATCDGFVIAIFLSTNGGGIEIYSDAANPPTTLVGWGKSLEAAAITQTVMIPIQQGNYWKVTSVPGAGTLTLVQIHWMAVGASG